MSSFWIGLHSYWISFSLSLSGKNAWEEPDSLVRRRHLLDAHHHLRIDPHVPLELLFDHTKKASRHLSRSGRDGDTTPAPCEARSQTMGEFLNELNDFVQDYVEIAFPVVYCQELSGTFAFAETGCQVTGCNPEMSCSSNPDCAFDLCVSNEYGCFEQSHCKGPCKECNCDVGFCIDACFCFDGCFHLTTSPPSCGRR